MLNHKQVSYLDIDLVPLLGDARPPDPNVVVAASPKLRGVTRAVRPDFLLTRVFQPLFWGNEFLQRQILNFSQRVEFQSRANRYSIRWDTGSGLLVQEWIEKERESAARITPVAYIGPQGVRENPDAALGRFQNPRFYRYGHRDELYICDADLSRFYLVDLLQEKVVSIKRLDRSLVNMGRGILVKGGDLIRFHLEPARRWETDLEMETQYNEMESMAIPLRHRLGHTGFAGTGLAGAVLKAVP